MDTLAKMVIIRRDNLRFAESCVQTLQIRIIQFFCHRLGLQIVHRGTCIQVEFTPREIIIEYPAVGVYG